MTLYRKYGPTSLAEVIGQDHIVELLQAAMAQERVAHAYLFAGPRGTGKTSVARILAKGLNCLERQRSSAKRSEGQIPCNDCDNCRAIDAGSYIDVVELDAASNRGVDHARGLIEQVATAPALGGYKVYILDEVHMLTTEAFNTLLKTLEEPPSKVVFVMCTTELHKVPVTIASRCQRLQFHRASVASVEQQLEVIVEAEKIAIEPAAVSLLAELADGGYRDAAMLLEQMVSAATQTKSKKIGVDLVSDRLGLASEALVFELMSAVHLGQTAEVLSLVEGFVAKGGSVTHLQSMLLQQWRLLLKVKTDATVAKTLISDDRLKRLEKIKDQVDVARLLKVMEKVLTAPAINPVGHPALGLEVALLDSMNSQLGGEIPAGSVGAPVASPRKKAVKVEMAAASAPVVAPAKTAAPVEEEAGGSLAVESDHAADSAPNNAEVEAVPANAPAELLQAWSEVLVRMSGRSRQLAAVLRDHCTPLSYDGKILLLQFWQEFYLKRFEQDKNRKILEEVSSGVMGAPVKSMFRLGDISKRPKRRAMSEEDVHNVAPVEDNAEELMDAASKIFGVNPSD